MREANLKVLREDDDPRHAKSGAVFVGLTDSLGSLVGDAQRCRLIYQSDPKPVYSSDEDHSNAVGYSPDIVLHGQRLFFLKVLGVKDQSQSYQKVIVPATAGLVENMSAVLVINAWHIMRKKGAPKRGA